jgi:hypothetical protein
VAVLPFAVVDPQRADVEPGDCGGCRTRAGGDVELCVAEKGGKGQESEVGRRTDRCDAHHHVARAGLGRMRDDGFDGLLVQRRGLRLALCERARQGEGS